MVPTPPDLPAIDSGPDLLRAAIAVKGQTEGWAAVNKFAVRPPCMSGWLNRNFRPNADHREIAWDEYEVPLASWDTKAERVRRLERLSRAGTTASAASKKPLPRTAPHRRRAVHPPPASEPAGPPRASARKAQRTAA